MVGRQELLDHQLRGADEPLREGDHEEAVDGRVRGAELLEIRPSPCVGLGGFERNDPAGPPVPGMHERRLPEELAGWITRNVIVR